MSGIEFRREEYLMPGAVSGDADNRGNTLNQRWRSLMVAAFLVFFTIAMVWILNGKLGPGWDFRFNLWTPASLLISGQSPYDVAVIQEGVLAVWMPVVIGALFPIGWLNIEIASNLWFVVNLIALLGTVILATGRKRPALYVLLITSLIVSIFPSSIVHFRIGQFTILTTFIFLTVVIYRQKLGLVLVALLVAFALAKPQLTTLVIPGILISINRQEGQEQVVKFVALLIVSAIVLTLPLFFGFPGWMSDFWHSMSSIPRNWCQPSLFSLLPQWVGTSGYILWGILALALFGLNLFLWIKLKPSDAIIWSLALTPLATPYIWSWDFVMILPLFARTTFYCRRKIGFLLLGSGYALTWYLTYRINISEDQCNHYFWWVPWLLFFVSVVTRFIQMRQRTIFESIFAFDGDLP